MINPTIKLLIMNVKLLLKSLKSVSIFFMILILLGGQNIFAQESLKLTGKILDSDGAALPGVNILEKGTSNGAVSDIEGNFTITLSKADAFIIVSSMGFETQEISVAGQTNVNVTLAPAAELKDEVVVVGYGSMKKKDLTGSTSSIKSADISSVKSVNALQVLQGKVSGLDVLQSSGEAGSSIKLMLRGRRSIQSGNDPLIIVDGVEYGTTLDINSSDIESLDILKDAASTAIYGTRGANGVIMVTTKKGSVGKTKVSYNNYFTSNSATYLPNIMNGSEYLEKRFETKLADADVVKWNAQGVSYNATTNAVTWNQTSNPDPASVWGTSTLDELIAAAGVTDKYELVTADPEGLQLCRDGVSLNYLDLLMVNSMSQNHEFAISGGDAKTALNLSIGYMNDNGLLRRDDMKRYNIKFGLDYKIAKTIKVGANVILTRKDYNKRNSGVFNQALKTGPIGILYNEDGTYRSIPDHVFADNQTNPMLDEVDGAYINEITNNRIFSNVYGNWDILPYLTFRTSLGLDYTTEKNGLFASAQSLSRITAATSQSSLQTKNSFGYTFDNTLNFSKVFGIHSIQAMLGTSTKYSRYQSLKVTSTAQATPETEYYDQNYATGATTESEYVPYQMVSVFGRVNYGLMDKYLVQLTLRNDNASQLAVGHKGAIFPSASFGWRISEEDFMKGLSFISNLKLRYSWGLAGNASSVAAFGTLATVSTNTNYFSFGSLTYQQYAPSTIANAALTWEKTQTHDIGVDFEIVNSRISGSIDVYRSNSYDLIFKIPLPSNQGGYSEALKNIAESENRGIELTLNTVNIKKGNFIWSSDWGLSYNENKITALYSGTDQMLHDGNQIWKVGSQVNSFFKYQVEGLYSIADLNAELDYVKQIQTSGGTIDKLMIPMLANKFYPGDVKIQDLTGDGIYNDADKLAQDADPQYTFNFNNNFSLKTNFGDFGLSILTIGRLNQNIDYTFYSSVKSAASRENGPYVEAWTPTRTNAIFPRYYSNGTNVTRTDFMSALQIVKGSFIKVKDITLSYTFPKPIISTLKLSNLRLYASAKNMLTFCDIDNYDPESNGAMNFPLAKQWIVGLNLDF
jgi:TonB-dependent starch-binding outer membrane protein SusC